MQITLSQTPSLHYSQKIARNFSRAASRYDQYAQIQRKIASQTCTRANFQDTDCVLDLGCATGHVTADIAQKVKRVVGVDIALTMIETASRHYPHVEFRHGDAQALPFADSEFSLVYSSMALQWCRSPLQALTEIRRVLINKGRAELSIMLADSFAELNDARENAGMRAVPSPLVPQEDWRRALAACDMQVNHANVIDYTDTHQTVAHLLRSISKIGAGYSQKTNPPLTRQSLQQLENAYPKAALQNGCFALTYRVLHLSLEKP